MPAKPKPTIDDLMRAYLATIPARKRRGPDGGVASSLELLQLALEGYGHQHLSRADSNRLFAALHEEDLANAIRARIDADTGVDTSVPPGELPPPGPFCRMFGVGPLVNYIDEFLDDFLIRKVALSDEAIRSAIDDVRDFFGWLAGAGHLTHRQAVNSLGRIARGADEVPAAEHLSRLLYEESRRSADEPHRFRGAEVIEDFLVVERVGPGRIWLIGVDGPLKVPEAASRVARPGWTINLVIGRDGDVWRVLEVGNVYPRILT